MPISATPLVDHRLMKIGIVAPSCRLERAIVDQLGALAAARFPGVSLVFDPQCHFSDGHFAGPDDARIAAFVAMANDPAIDAIWFARGGYGSNRVAIAALPQLGDAARRKAYLGYSDAGFMLAGLYARGIGRVAHGPMPADIKREGGEEAVLRSLAWLVDPAGAARFEPPYRSGGLNLSPPLTGTRHKLAAFNLTVFASLLGTPLEPDLSDHVLMLEEVSEYMYRIDRTLFQITATLSVRQVAGLMLGRCLLVPDNDPDFMLNEEQIVEHYCGVSGIRYLGRADIGHDAENKVVPFG
jgi:muramoyltetrapeptide carboxypeptidase